MGSLKRQIKEINLFSEDLCIVERQDRGMAVGRCDIFPEPLVSVEKISDLTTLTSHHCPIARGH